jgi:shikimate kinase
LKGIASATTTSAVSIINAIGTGFGGAIGINIPCTARARFVRGKKVSQKNLIVMSEMRDTHNLIPSCVSAVQDYLSLDLGEEDSLSVEVHSEIPLAVGLKSSSAISTAVVSAVSRALSAKELSPQTILELSCTASMTSGASITGAYDDALCCLLGGLALTNNPKFQVIKYTKIPKELGTIVVLRIPRHSKVFTSDVKKDSYSKFNSNALQAFQLAKKGNYSGAIMMNSLIQCSALGYSFKPINSAIIAGAACAGISGKGPTTFALCTTKRVASSIESTWAEPKGRFKVIRTTVVQPRKGVL